MQYTGRIVTDETFMETASQGSEDYPFIFYNETIELYDFSLIDWHWHPELEFLFVSSGSVTAWINQEQIEISEGEGVFINSKALHRFHSSGHAVIPNFLFLPSFLSPEESLIHRKFILPVLQSETSYCLFRETVPWQTEILTLMKDLIFGQTEGTMDELAVCIKIQQIWAVLSVHVSKGNPAGKKKQLLSSQGRLLIMMEYIHSHYQEAVTLEDIAGAAGISKSSTLKIFKTTLHTTPVEYLIHCRMKKAASILSKTEKKIGTVALETGFESVDYFCRTFKKHYLMTPGEYRKRKNAEP